MANNELLDDAVNMDLLLEFHVIFPTEAPLSPEDYLRGGGRNVILDIASFFLSFKNQGSKFKDIKELLNALFGPENNGFANEVYFKIQSLEEAGKRVQIIHTYSSLRLFEIFFQSEGDERTQKDADFEINIFKAILVLNSEYTNKQARAFSSTKVLGYSDFGISMMQFCMSYPINDKVNYNIYQVWVTQLIKAIFLFQFLENEHESKSLLIAFLKDFKCQSWEEYLRRLMPLINSAIKDNNEKYTNIEVERGEKFEENCKFIEKLIIKDDEELNKNDFLSLRAKPFYKVAEGTYRIIFPLFVVEKIFKGAYFLLNEVNNKVATGPIISNLKSFFGAEFSEKILLYKILKIIYSRGLHFSGKELSDKHIDGEPDYYLRVHKDILLFESKDFLINAIEKWSFDFEVYQKEFKNKLYYTESKGRIKPKAVLQFIENIRKILNNELTFDNDYKYREVYIYPILITHDHQYDVLGFSSLINDWFQAEIQNLADDGFFVHRIKPIVIINIDTLLYYQDALRDNVPLHQVVKEYVEFIKGKPHSKFATKAAAEAYIMSKQLPFSSFIDHYFVKRGLKKFPGMLEDLSPELFKN